MGLRLRRSLGAESSLQPGEWCSLPDVHTPGTTITRAVACPGCGGVSRLGPGHVVSRGGVVTPAFKCPTVTCSFHEWLSLDGHGDPT